MPRPRSSTKVLCRTEAGLIAEPAKVRRDVTNFAAPCPQLGSPASWGRPPGAAGPPGGPAPAHVRTLWPHLPLPPSPTRELGRAFGTFGFSSAAGKVSSCLRPSRRAVVFPGTTRPGSVQRLQLLWPLWPPRHTQDFSPSVTAPLIPCPCRPRPHGRAPPPSTARDTPRWEGVSTR